MCCSSYILTFSVPLPQKCQRIRIRKDAHKLTQVEKRQLQHAMNGIIQDGNFQEIASYHGAPYGEKCYIDSVKKMGCCKHVFELASYEDFWSWHRLYMGKKLQILANYIINFTQSSQIVLAFRDASCYYFLTYNLQFSMTEKKKFKVHQNCFSMFI